MSILYIHILAVDSEKHNIITDYKLINVFQNTKELTQWLNPERYQTLVQYQNITGKDIDREGYLRPYALYDDQRNIFLDVRNYMDEETCTQKTEPLLYTQWQTPRRKRKQQLRHQRTVTRAKNGSMIHDLRRRSDRYFPVDTDFDDHSIRLICQVPKPIRASRRTTMCWDGTISKTENNWKDKKIRHQWQYHKQDIVTYRLPRPDNTNPAEDLL